MIKYAVPALAAIGLASAPIAAQSVERIASPVDASEELSGGYLGWLLAALVAAGVLIVILADDDSDVPVSP